MDTTENEQSESPQQGNADSNRTGVIGPPSGRIPKEPPSRHANGQPEKKRKWTKDPPMFWVSVVGVVVVAAYTSVAAWQVCLTRDQLTVSQRQLDAMEADQRPWVKIVKHTIVGFRFDAEAGHIQLQFLLKNVGRRPAVGIEISPELHPIAPETFRTFDTQQAAICEKAARNGAYRETEETVFADDTQELNVEAVMPISEIPKRDSPGWPFVVFGCIDYLISANGKHGQTGFRYYIGKRLGGAILGVIPSPVPRTVVNPAELEIIVDMSGNYAK